MALINKVNLALSPQKTERFEIIIINAARETTAVTLNFGQ